MEDIFSGYTGNKGLRGALRGRGLIFLVYLDLSILGAGGQHLCVPTEAHTQHCVVHHHEVILSLVLKILKDTNMDLTGAFISSDINLVLFQMT